VFLFSGHKWFTELVEKTKIREKLPETAISNKMPNKSSLLKKPAKKTEILQKN